MKPRKAPRNRHLLGLGMDLRVGAVKIKKTQREKVGKPTANN
jgi:hypothetical protein